MSTRVDLPEDIWKLVLQHVPLKQRLSNCALVCQKFKAAAVAATDSIEAILFEQPAVDAFATYLQQHGSHLTSLVLTGTCSCSSNWPELEELPCRHLRELHLVSIDLGWGPDTDRPSVLDNATSITRLELQGSNFFSAALSVLPSLQHLSINSVDNSFCQDEFHCASAFSFASLQQLTHLGLTRVEIEDESLAYISSMCSLHTLHIIECCDESPATSGLSLPPSLQHFKASDAFEPSLLAAATKLTHLGLSCEWVPDEGDADFGAEWLRVLSKLQHLDYLQLILRYSNWPPASPAYQALVASSSTLRVLLVDSRVPGAAFAHIFPSAPSHVLLPRLEVLAAFGIPQDSLGDVVRCCPALQQLTLKGESLGSAHLTALSQLSALTRLDLSLEPRIADASTAVSIQNLAGLKRLQDLTLGLDTNGLPVPVEWSDALLQTLLPLTALQGLTRLLCAAGDRTVHRSMQAGSDHPPDVWLQLLELCAADSTCQRSIIRGHAQQLVEQQQDVKDLRQQLALVQQQLAQQEQHSAQLQQLLTGLQQQQTSQQHGR